MSFADTIFLFILALVIFGPKKLPEMARQAGKLLAELRRASNEFRSQIEDEISQLEVEKNKQNIMMPKAAPPGAVASLSLNPGASPDAGASNPSATASLAGAPAPEAAGTLAGPVAAPAAIATVVSASEADSHSPSNAQESHAR
jgi:sec-independent protein translocase protein TatB